MRDLRDGVARIRGMKGNVSRVLVVLLAATGLTAGLAVAASDGGGDDPGTLVVERYDLWLSLPSGWHASRARLVPNLLMPRELVSVGTFGMAPGGGGNCGREPARAIGRMRPRDALVSIQEYAVGPRLRGHLGSNFAAEPRLGRLGRAQGAYAGGSSGSPVYSATIPFRRAGRAFDALVYFRGRPTAAGRAEVSAILAGLRLGPDGPFSGGGDARA
jgi:hypothetical protein